MIRLLSVFLMVMPLVSCDSRKVSVEGVLSPRLEGELPTQGPMKPDEGLYRTALNLSSSLNARRSPEEMRIVDVRTKEAFSECRIPGSIHIRPHLLSRDKRLMEGKVVLVDDGIPAGNARDWAHGAFSEGRDVSILHGGLQAWIRGGGKTSGLCRRVGMLSANALLSTGKLPDELAWVWLDGEESWAHLKFREFGEMLSPIISRQSTLRDTLATLEKEARTSHVVLFDRDGENSQAMYAMTADVDLNLFYLEGGAIRLQRQINVMASAGQKERHTQNTRVKMKSSGEKRKASAIPEGCGCL